MKKLPLLLLTGIVVFGIGICVIVSCNSANDIPTKPDTYTLGSPEEISQRIAEIRDFIKIEDSVKMTLKLDLQRESYVRISERAVEVGNAIVSMNNKLAGAGFSVDHSTNLDSELAILEPFFSSVAESSTYEVDSLGSGSTNKVSSPQLHCPPRNYASRFWSSEAAVRNHLLSIGFHRVPNYATTADGPDGYSLVDFAVFVSSGDTYGWCGYGTYRTEAAIARFGTQYTYYIQVSEPNPEIWAYNWTRCPGAWWPGFVAWWHCCYC